MEVNEFFPPSMGARAGSGEKEGTRGASEGGFSFRRPPKGAWARRPQNRTKPTPPHRTDPNDAAKTDKFRHIKEKKEPGKN